MFGKVNPMQMMGALGNPNALMQQIFGNNPQMMQIAQQIMSGNVNQSQLQGLLNQQMGKNAPNLQQIMDTLQRLKTNGEVIVVDDKALFAKFSNMGAGDILRYSPSVKGIEIMSRQEFEANHM